MEKITQVASKPDAGLRSFDHYKHQLPPWRYNSRQRILPFIRWETPYLAWLQEKTRSPSLDSYFAITANLGTHMCFMIVIPILFWCGYTSLGRGLIHILAAGVYSSGFVKDMWCLPRPLSPPLQRITMSGSAALEYGFPSTHATNSVSVAVYALYILMGKESTTSWSNTISQALCYCYASSIVLGRLYCGMHGFIDVIIGSLLGGAIALVHCFYGETFELYIYGAGSCKPVLIAALILLVLIRIHPEPADDCPCFDDSVACAGVIIGVELGSWHFHQTGHEWPSPSPAIVPFDLETLGWPKVIMRIAMGVVIVFAWREAMKPTLLRFLPPLFRAIESLGLSLPRKFFINASQYQKVPKHLKDDNVIPSFSEIPSLLTSIRFPRSRTVSVGPQSEADAYETLAYREKRRRDSMNAGQTRGQSRSPSTPLITPDADESADKRELPATRDRRSETQRRHLKLSEYEDMMGTGFDSLPGSAVAESPSVTFDTAVSEPSRREQGEKEMFERLQKPRVHYDVEVVTKLIVYAGIGWLVAELNPLLFEAVGLGMNGYEL